MSEPQMHISKEGDGYLRTLMSVEEMGAKVDYQLAAPAETGTPNLHRAKIAHKRVRMEGWRQRRPGSNARNPREGKRKTHLTHTSLLMEGVDSRSTIRSGRSVRHA